MRVDPWDEGYTEPKSIKRSLTSRKSNADGHAHEKLIEGACRYYAQRNRAYIVKEPEPFAVKKKYTKTTACVQFINKAQPDFHGTLPGGRAIVFEAKYTATEQMKRDVISGRQEESLDFQASLGAAAFVCVGIKNDAFMVPWQVFRNMKAIFGRQYVRAKDLETWRVRNDSLVYFLDYVGKAKAKKEK